MRAVPETVDQSQDQSKDLRPLTGNEAIARGAWEAGVRVAAAYPGTPSTEIMESLAGYPAADLHAQWSTNEKVALDVARSRQIEVAPGDKVLIRANEKRFGLINGRILTISSIAPGGALQTKEACACR